ncbi:DUF2804 domain-containing protein [Hahella ganghwensis]|uniref:DUF2804 domain-containing protein n=1 Tax=Hahella ganghwensis TaxID=286420 RepID=UPI000371815C|nr:DUF2804 domain-containing protein [Hahella ganghwensis]
MTSAHPIDSLRPAPLIFDGNPRTGRLEHPVSEINYMDFNFCNAMDKPYPLWRRKMRFNQFHFYGLTAPDLFIGLAIVDLKWASNAFLYVFDATTGEFQEYNFIAPLGLKTHIGLTPESNDSRFNNSQASFEFTSNDRGHQLKVSIGQTLELDARLNFPSPHQPLRLCCPAGYNGWVFTQKSAGLEVTGTLKQKGKSIDLQERGCWGSSDYSCGFMRRETVWKWTCINGQDQEGNPLGLNLANGVNETGMTENTLWYQGQTIALPPVQYRFSRTDTNSAWGVTSEDGAVDLHFIPSGKRTSKENFLMIASNFRQFFGHYSGRLRLPSGEELEIKHQPGFAEDHYARW